MMMMVMIMIIYIYYICCTYYKYIYVRRDRTIGKHEEFDGGKGAAVSGNGEKEFGVQRAFVETITGQSMSRERVIV